MADLTGKHAIVTGATNGIGEVTALELAARGATVTVVSRSEDKCRRTAALIDRETGSEANYIQADLSSIDDTRRAAAAYRDRFERLDILVNNAGAVFTERKESVDGIELTQALNHLGYFVLTAGLLDLIKATAAAHPAWGARIVNVSSGAHRSGANWDDPLFEENYTPFAAYGQSKAFNIMFTYDLARRLAGTGVTVNAVHPGLVATGFGRNNGPLMNVLGALARPFSRSPEKGAETSVYLAASDEVAGATGQYWKDKQAEPSEGGTTDPANWERMWALSEAWIRAAQPA